MAIVVSGGSVFCCGLGATKKKNEKKKEKKKKV